MRRAGAARTDAAAPEGPAAAEVEAANVFVARQPVFTRGLQVHGYELLFRPSSSDSAFADIDANLASSRVISNGLCSLGWDALTGGRAAYINVTRELLVGDQLRLLPASSTVVEIGTDTPADPEVLAACARLRRAGYRLALDDFRWRTERAALLDAVDAVKVDVSRLGRDGGDLGIPRLVARGVDVVAAKVETRAAFADAVELGCSHFQGYFFR